jgi:hypothetical protein
MISSKYTVLSNKPLDFEVISDPIKIRFSLPFWFTDWPGQKLIKVYGCSFAYLETETVDGKKVPKLSTKYANQFISVHSNITQDETEHLTSFYDNTVGHTVPDSNAKPSQSEIDILVDFMMIANNYYTPKIFDLTNSTLKEIVIWFKDAYGQTIPLKNTFTPPSGVYMSEFYQALFKIEIELAVSEKQK